MPRKRITFIVIPANDGQVREYRFPTWLLGACAGAFLLFIGALGYYTSGYYQKVGQEVKVARLSDENQDLTRSLEQTRRLVGELEETMQVLVSDDERLRAYHLMEPLAEEMRLGGVGGTEDLPEDFTSLPSNKRILVNELSMRIHRLKQEARLQEQSFREIERKFRESEGDLKHFPTISPVPRDQAWISSEFGWRVDPFTGRRAFHSGIDFAGRTGTPIHAAANGVITYAYSDLRLGKVVVIEHDIEGINESGETYSKKGVYRTEYGHLSEILVHTGERVRRGQVIGKMGSTGRSTGPHLHYAVRYQDRRLGGYKGYLDPKDFLLDRSPRDAQVANWWRAEE